MSRRRYKLILLIVSVFLVVLLYHRARNYNESQPLEAIPAGHKCVLLYTKLWGKSRWWLHPIDFNFKRRDGSNCPHNKCFITYDKRHIGNCDLVVLHGRDMNDWVFERYKMNKHKQQSPNAKWVYFIHESPYHLSHDLTTYDHLFNWVASYQPSNQVFIPYFEPVKLRNFDRLPLPNTNFANGKDKKIFVAISNCVSYRIELIKKLKKYTDVDVYGGCKSEFKQKTPICKRYSAECLKLRKRYKFSLSFENSFCDGYVTEKLFVTGLQETTVPIVLSKADFKNPAIVPKHSTINVLDFNTVKELADYINYLDHNDTAYSEYHAWRYTQKIMMVEPICRFCDAAWEHAESAKEDSPKVSEVVNVKNRCIPYTDEIFQKYLR